ncbi:hypothetical protein TVAG_083690 [Trichomonas vaginalis G3]|uniref:DH domain-containing protein n=1 Tax=Trichomonas vaginalis (strain ATCC PRA-98 / G3) TaxID=412133 RepID=A2DM94_TRIV3|nr:spectrin binding [Trichomonas vaginalis G3]EAY18514.1 hypothetical protein TVAG_083690 [Trichomonas vaginalis G3]KAI5489497.1 spectrin binding [Trichomonas vaginalis G3]|eukprot:XP_001579500.1 hypothetical protein [Trichomonas vaginalis G3]
MKHSFAEGNVNALLEACLNSDEKHLQQLLDNFNAQNIGLDFYYDDNGRTLLHILASYPDFKYWKLLLNSFIYLDSTDSSLQTALHIAVLNKNVEACRALLKFNVSFTAEDEKGFNPVQLAFLSNDKDVLDSFLDFNLPFKYMYNNKHSIAKLCFDNNCIESFEYLCQIFKAGSLMEIDEDGKAIIHYAAQLSNKSFMQILLDYNVDINQKTTKPRSNTANSDDPNSVGLTALDIATNPEVIELLAYRGAVCSREQKEFVKDIVQRVNKDREIFNDMKEPIDIVDYNNYTPLIYALLNKHSRSSKQSQLSLIQQLLDKKANPNFFTSTTTAYHIAAETKNIEAIKLFLKYQQPPAMTSRDSVGKTCIIYAVESEDPETVKVLVTGQKVSQYDYDTLAKLLFSFDDDIASQMAGPLIEGGFPPDTKTPNGESLLYAAVKNCKPMLAEVCIKLSQLSQADLDNLLVEAVMNECPVVPTLLKCGASITMYHGRPLFHFTAKHRTSDALIALMKDPNQNKTSVDTRGNTYVHYAALLANPRAIKDSFSILKLDANTQNSEEETPLHILTQSGGPSYRQCFEALIENNANPLIVNKMKQNILHYAARYGHTDVLDFLLNQGGLTEEQKNQLYDQQDANGFTPLESALLANMTEAGRKLTKLKAHPIFDSPLTYSSIKAFLDRGLSPNVFDKDDSPLINNVVELYDENKPNDCITLVQLLLDAGANSSLVDSKTESAFHHALRKKDINLCKMLMDAGSSFLVGRPLNVICEEMNLKEIGAMIKKPLRRACAALELCDIFKNACKEYTAAFELLNDELRKCPEVQLYIPEMENMQRLMDMFVARLAPIVNIMKPTTNLGDIFIYFVDAFAGSINVSTAYCAAKAVIDKSPNIAPMLNNTCKLSRNNLNDLLIIPVQIMTRLGSLVEAILVNTNADTDDYKALQKTYTKFMALGIETNERQLIFDSQKKLEQIHILYNNVRFFAQDVLVIYENFTIVQYTEPPTFKPIGNYQDWGLSFFSCETPSGLQQKYFKASSSDLKDMLSGESLTIFFFRKFVLFGQLMKDDKFQLIYRCNTDEILFDFGAQHGPDGFVIWTPIGKLHLKVNNKGGGIGGDFVKKQWRVSATKLYAPDPATEESPVNGETVHVAWVSKQTNCVHTTRAIIRDCKNREEARQKILKYLKDKKVDFIEIPNAEGEIQPLVLSHFITYRPPKGQSSDVLSDFLVR